MKLPKIVFDRILQNDGEVMVSTEGGPVFPSWAEAREIAHRCNVHDELVAALSDLLTVANVRIDDHRCPMFDCARAAIAKAKGKP